MVCGEQWAPFFSRYLDRGAMQGVTLTHSSRPLHGRYRMALHPPLVTVCVRQLAGPPNLHTY